MKNKPAIGVKNWQRIAPQDPRIAGLKIFAHLNLVNSNWVTREN